MCCCCGHFDNEPCSRIHIHSFIYFGVDANQNAVDTVEPQRSSTSLSLYWWRSLCRSLFHSQLEWFDELLHFHSKIGIPVVRTNPSRFAWFQWAFTRMRLYTAASSTSPSHDASHTHMFFQILLIHRMFVDFYRGLYIYRESERGKERKNWRRENEGPSARNGKIRIVKWQAIVRAEIDGAIVRTPTQCTTSPVLASTVRVFLRSDRTFDSFIATSQRTSDRCRQSVELTAECRINRARIWASRKHILVVHRNGSMRLQQWWEAFVLRITCWRTEFQSNRIGSRRYVYHEFTIRAPHSIHLPRNWSGGSTNYIKA